MSGSNSGAWCTRGGAGASPPPAPVLSARRWASLCLISGTLTKFTLVLYGTATDSPSLSNQLESSGCKTLTPSQTCVGECQALGGGAHGGPLGVLTLPLPQSVRRGTTCTRRAA